MSIAWEINMLYRKMEKTGDELSILGFGCMRLPQKNGKSENGRIDEERATKQIRYAIDHGVNYLDTAMPYHMGGSEPFLGRALTDGYRERIKLATKLPPWAVKIKQDMDDLLKVQLSKLKTDHIDYYLLHGLDGKSWEKMKELGAIEFLDKAKADGRIINAGFSFHGDRDTFKEIINAYDWEFCQIQYNFLDEQNQAGTEGLKYAAEKGICVVVMEPLRGGNITKRIPQAVQEVWDQAETKRTPAEWALRWVWNHPEVTVVLSGMNEEKHIEENIRIAGEAYPDSLTQEELDLVARVRDTYRDLMKVGCTGCRYCMPCPSGVDIPACFEFYNNIHIFGGAKMMYAWTLNGSYASQCKNCGKCEKACPQHLHIPELLKDVSGEFEGLLLKPTIWLLKGFMTLQRWSSLRKARKLGN
jgi:predicted aldo/keto reductase-like oxidoreductase